MSRWLWLMGALAVALWWWLRPLSAPTTAISANAVGDNTARSDLTHPRATGQTSAPAASASPAAALMRQCDSQELDRTLWQQRQHQLLANLNHQLNPSRPLDWRLLVMLHPTPMLDQPELLATALTPERSNRIYPLHSIGAIRRQLELLDWLAALRKDSNAIPAGYGSIGAFLDTPLQGDLSVKHLLLRHADALPSSLLASLLAEVAWVAEDSQRLPLEMAYGWPAGHWQALFATIPELGHNLPDSLLLADGFDRLLLSSAGIGSWSPLLAVWPLNQPPQWRWPLPSAVDLAMLAGPEAETQLTSWQQLGIANSIADDKDGRLQLPLWGQPGPRPDLTDSATINAGLSRRLPATSYHPDERQHAARLRQQLQPIVAELNQLSAQLAEAEQQCQPRRQQLEEQQPEWYWSLRRQGVAPLENQGLDCLAPDQLAAIADVDPAAAETCAALQQPTGNQSLAAGQPLASWLQLLEQAAADGDIAPLLRHIRQDQDVSLLLQLVSRYSPQLLPALQATGITPTSSQLQWLDGEGARTLLAAGVDLGRISGERSALQLLAANDSLDLPTLEALTAAGISENASALRRDALDILLERLILLPRRDQLAVVATLRPLMEVRPSHWRRMAILRLRNQALYDELTAALPELMPPAEMEPLLIE